MLKKQKRVLGYRDRLIVWDGGQGNLTPCAVPEIDNLPKGADDDGDWYFDGAIGGESLQRVGVKGMLLESRDTCPAKERSVPTNFAEKVELA